MRTKALLLAAAMVTVSAVGAMAQVYSQNAVGYYTLQLKAGYNMIANQFTNGANTLNEVFPSGLPDDSFMLTWNNAPANQGGQQFVLDYWLGDVDKWYDGFLENPSTTVLEPGQGGFLNVPSATSVTLVGEVPQGNLIYQVATGYSILSQLTPQENLGLQATGFPAGADDSVLYWDADQQTYKPDNIVFIGDPDFVWYNFLTDEVVDPSAPIGGSFFYFRNPLNGTSQWTRTFTVNP